MVAAPAMIFQSAQQQAYSHFARILEQNPIQWPMLALVAACMVIGLPVTEARPSTAVR